MSSNGEGALLAQMREWRNEVSADAACQNHEPEIWFPDREGGLTAARQAQRICSTECGVAAMCLVVSLNDKEHFGIWGGLTVRQRATVRQQFQLTSGLRGYRRLAVLKKILATFSSSSSKEAA